MALRSRRSTTDYADWRYELLIRAGFGPALARQIIGDPRIDIHRLLELIDRGCPPHLAARILAPLEQRDDFR
jgi:hypothetical protein